ncbi:EAL domain-containing protein [Salipiger bermudensis]|uniref:EAL domain protein n=1 Tax=Salipiger bermudensis (strain DSM 26914 / JCM 13377 / KCTC 12554 / HTCC2601) TaxID=314265 RepID=Q0FIP2_SALBH|nr:EAL domain-containing protein [Salipiger bermudensis]EAU44043.1 EAL domain protein [Salipiger bermudensis HTCC2601]MBN9676424.1 EAL domain-containing protein [Salipiger bermudensis]MCA1285292.1 EAL domain-containing protein [Salipiger bermudensis]
MRGPPPKQGQNALELALAKRDSTILRTVREAIRHRQVMLAFQPVVQARRQEATAFHEGLIRVLDETGRVVPAREFIETVEESEDGRILDCIALEQGLRELEREPGLRLAINMSARSIGYGDWLDTLTRGLRAGPTVAERLILEITEASAMMVPELVISFMDDLQARGVTFAMDDFGAGYTALRHFKQFSFDILKIDGLFIRGIAQDPDNQVMTTAIIEIARQFDMFTVAESVERAEDARLLTGIGIDCLQGYFFGAPTVSPAWRAPPSKHAHG